MGSRRGGARGTLDTSPALQGGNEAASGGGPAAERRTAQPWPQRLASVPILPRRHPRAPPALQRRVRIEARGQRQDAQHPVFLAAPRRHPHRLPQPQLCVVGRCWRRRHRTSPLASAQVQRAPTCVCSKVGGVCGGLPAPWPWRAACRGLPPPLKPRSPPGTPARLPPHLAAPGRRSSRWLRGSQRRAAPPAQRPPGHR